jgi:hypothetical protein
VAFNPDTVILSHEVKLETRSKIVNMSKLIVITGITGVQVNQITSLLPYHQNFLTHI